MATRQKTQKTIADIAVAHEMHGTVHLSNALGVRVETGFAAVLQTEARIQGSSASSADVSRHFLGLRGSDVA